MTNPDIQWIVIAPGVMELPTTKYRIDYVASSDSPFQVSWNGKRIPACLNVTLDEAQRAAKRPMADLIAMGLEV